jgi:hypothetical protein
MWEYVLTHACLCFNICLTYRVSYLTWNPPRQHAATAASELPGNELVTHNAEHSRRMLVAGFRVTWDILYNEDDDRVFLVP